MVPVTHPVRWPDPDVLDETAATVARVQQLLPDPRDVDPAAAHASAERPPPEGRPWVLLNMIASADGATAVDGVSGGLGGPADKQVFSAIRAVADVIVVAAGTARAEQYGPPRTPPERRAERHARGQAPYPRLALVTRSLDLDPTSAMFTEAPEPPLVYTVSSAPTARRAALAAAELVEVGEEDVDLAAVLGDLHRRGAKVVLVEGGPSLNGQLIESGLVDELNLTLAPWLLAGPSPRVAAGPVARPSHLDLAHLWQADGLLFARYVRG